MITEQEMAKHMARAVGEFLAVWGALKETHKDLPKLACCERATALFAAANHLEDVAYAMLKPKIKHSGETIACPVCGPCFGVGKIAQQGQNYVCAGCGNWLVVDQGGSRLLTEEEIFAMGQEAFDELKNSGEAAQRLKKIIGELTEERLEERRKAER